MWSESPKGDKCMDYQFELPFVNLFDVETVFGHYEC